MLLAARAFAQSDEWEQVPSDSGEGAATEGGGTASAPARDKSAMASRWWERSSSKRRSCATRA
jgi:hypothetical protein